MSRDLSICILTRQARDLLRACLRSLAEHTHDITYEVIVVDNASDDGTLDMLRDEFPTVRVIANAHNAGFTRASNQAIRVSTGRYVLLLNNDTLILPAAFDRLVAFADRHPEIGIVSPQVLNRDGTLQKQCRRSFATPWDLFCYFSGLATLFPRSRLFGRYLMTFMDANVTHPADAVSGSCMLIRRAVLDQIGLLDERFFAYQEDTDLCFRAHHAGWQVYYFHEARIIHYGGQGGSRIEPYRSIIEWHKSYFYYYRKNLARRYIFLFNWFYYLVMALKLAAALLVNFVRADKFAGSKKP